MRRPLVSAAVPAVLLCVAAALCLGFYRGATATEPSGDGGWSETLNGVRARVLPAEPTATLQHRRGGFLPLRVQVQNHSDAPVPYRQLWMSVRVRVHDERGELLGVYEDGPMIGDWAGREGNLEPGQISELEMHFQSLRFNRALEAGETVTLRVSAPTQKERPGQLPLEVLSEPLSVEFIDAYPLPLSEADFPPIWKCDLALWERGGLGGSSRNLRLRPDGRATLVQPSRRERPSHRARLDANLDPEALADLAGTLRSLGAWKLDDLKTEIAHPDEPTMQVALVCSTGGSLVRTFPRHVEAREPVVKEFADRMRALMDKITTQAAATQPSETHRSSD